jgi:hypothetical protein
MPPYRALALDGQELTLTRHLIVAVGVTFGGQFVVMLVTELFYLVSWRTLLSAELGLESVRKYD